MGISEADAAAIRAHFESHVKAVQVLTKSSHFRAAPAPAPAVAPKPSSAVKRKAKEIASSSKGAKKPKLSTAGKNLPAATAAKQKKPAASKIPSSVSAAPAKTVIDVKPGGEERGTAVKAKKRPITVAAPIAPTAAVAIDRPATVVGSTKAAAWVRAESAAVGQQDTAKSKSKPTAGALAAGKGVPSKSRGGAFTYPTPADLKFFRTMYAPIADPLATSRDELLQFYADHQFTEWLALLDLNQSLYLHGVGSQERLLRGFVKSCLAGEDVLQLSCGMDRMYPTASAVGGRQQSWHNVVLNLLRIIANEILSKPLPSSVSLAASASTRGGGRARGPGVLDQLDLSVSAVTAMLLDESLSLIHKTEIICEALLQYHGYGLKSSFRASAAFADQVARGPDAQAEGLAVMSYNRPSKLYVIVIDHPSAQPLAASSSAAGREKARAEKALAMRCLGLLASCRAVGLIAATTSINTICQACDLDTLSLFNWAYVHCPTYEPAIVELSAKDFGVNFATYTSQRADIALEGEDATADNASFTNLKFVINSLTRKHKDMLRVLCNYSQEEERRTKADGKSAAAPAMLWSRFVGVCTDSLIVRGDPDMRYLMRELIEHRLVAQSVGDGPKSVCLVCPAQVLITLL